MQRSRSKAVVLQVERLIGCGRVLLKEFRIPRAVHREYADRTRVGRARYPCDVFTFNEDGDGIVLEVFKPLGVLFRSENVVKLE